MKFLLAGAMMLGVASASCPNGCSGHGSCKLGEVCDCQPRWVGADCGSRECPYGVSWVTSSETGTAAGGASYDTIASTNQPFPGDAAYMGEGGRHEYTECSSKGSCDRSSGECQCFEGYTGKGCRKMKCPNDCSGNGMCMTNFEINSQYHDVSPDSQMWDWNKATQCKCDPGFHGLDCSMRTCPKGDDPLTNCAAGTEVSDIQEISWNTADGGSDGWFSLTFTDAYGANYTTVPIFAYSDPEGTVFEEGATDTNSGQDGAHGLWKGRKTAAAMEAALEGLPNFAIPNITVTFTGAVNGIPAESGTNTFDVTFLDAGNAGLQNLLECSYTGDSSYNHAAASPRFSAPADAFGRVCTAKHVAQTGNRYPASAGYKIKESSVCSNRGDCATRGGVCEGGEGYPGAACREQTFLF